ncbi:MAG: ubiquinone biosynthesis protein [Flavobacteriales bacterium]|jgi:ubiquinone biosynthesis protein|tara:strand:- start:11268 stop:12911 length:1644 start_codon:yes stop_codon:yes gene_type:complete
MEYTVVGRARKVNRLFFSVLPRFLWFKLYSPFLHQKLKEKRLLKLHQKSAVQIAEVFMQLEGLFVKFSQQVSTMSGILPEAYIKEFEKAQSHSVTRPFTQIKTRIESELKGNLTDFFSSFNETPIGTASIGQVHKGTLKSGEIVAVKVQHLNIEEIAKLDLDLILKLFRIVQVFIKIPGFNSVFEEVKKMIQEELDYVHEAQQIEIISSNLKKDDRIVIPKVYNQLSTGKVLVMDFVEGEKITDRAFLAQNGIDTEVVIKNFLDIFSKNIFIDGVYHADPHPGNVLVNESGQIVLLDFGAVGNLGKKMKEGIIILMQAAILKDENLMITGFKKMGFIGDAPGVHQVCKKIIRLIGDFLVNELKIESININQVDMDQIDFSKVFSILKKIDLKEIEEVVKIPKDWVLLNRTIALIMGITTELAPNVDVFKTVKPNLYRMAIQKESLEMILKTTLQQQALRLISLPRKMEVFLAQAENGELEVNSKSRKIEVKLIYALAQQFLFTIGAILCYYLYNQSANVFMLYLSITSAVLFIKSFVFGVYYKRKLR